MNETAGRGGAPAGKSGWQPAVTPGPHPQEVPCAITPSTLVVTVHLQRDSPLFEIKRLHNWSSVTAF